MPKGFALACYCLFFRWRSVGQIIDPVWLLFSFPIWYYYHVLRGLQHLRRAVVTPDERLADANELVESKRGSDGRWLLENWHHGTMRIEMYQEEGKPSDWNRLLALRILDWYTGPD